MLVIPAPAKAVLRLTAGAGLSGFVDMGKPSSSCMSVVMYTDECSFRSGACHAALWLSVIARDLVAEGRAGDDLVARLGEMQSVLIDWHNAAIPMPEGPPWHWDGEELEHFIALRKADW